ncbi:MAG: putative porin [Nitrospiria bacterium]
MKGWFCSVLMILGVGFSAFGARAEGERKTMEDLLVDKGVLTKDEAAAVQGRKFAAWIDRVTFSGDLRLRQESFWKDPAADRHRQRFRLRLGSELKIGDLTVGIRLASGTGEQTSTNQSFDNLFSQKGIWIDRAFLRWQGSNSKWLALTGGKMPNPFFTVYSTDAIWDEDVSPEGFAENFNVALGTGTVLFVNVAQLILDEDAGDTNDQWLFGQQVGISVAPAKDVKTTLAATYYNFVNAEDGNFGQVTCLSGNTRATPPVGSCELLNDYNVLDVTALLALKAGPLPVSVMGDYIMNTADPQDAAGNDTKDNGYQTGIILGKAGDPETWEAAYFYKRMGTDATVADLADADFGDGGTDRKGHIVWIAYSPTKALMAKLKFFRTERLSATRDDIDRLQADLVVKF